MSYLVYRVVYFIGREHVFFMFPRGCGKETAQGQISAQLVVSGGQATPLRILCRKAEKRISEKMGCHAKHDLTPLL